MADSAAGDDVLDSFAGGERGGEEGKEGEAAISLVEFDETRDEPPFLTSPRSLEACARHGVLPEELVKR